MSETFDLDARKRRIRYRAWHRGLRELELLLGRFVDTQGDALDAQDVADFEALLDVPDQTLLGWLMGDAPPDAGYDTRFWQRLQVAGITSPR